MSRFLLRALPLTLLVCLASSAAAQAAPTIFPGQKCNRYVPAFAGERWVGVGGYGFSPNAFVRLAWQGGDYAGNAITNAGGAFGGGFFMPSSFIPRSAGRVRSYNLYAQDGGTGAITGTSVRFVRVGVGLPSRARPRTRVRYRLYGFRSSRPVWANYTFAGKRRVRVYMGRTSSLCGTLSKRQRFLPTRTRYGRWRIYFSHHKRFTRRSSYYYVEFTVYRTYYRRADGARTASSGPLVETGAQGPLR